MNCLWKILLRVVDLLGSLKRVNVSKTLFDTISRPSLLSVSVRGSHQNRFLLTMAFEIHINCLINSYE